jgi:hypothetical protein
MPHHETLATLATSPADYERFGLLPARVALWEDGARTDNRSGTYEWWYFDAHLDDGSKLVVIFMNKDLAAPDRPLSPILRVNLDLPDGRSYQKVVPFPAQDWSAAADRADVRLGANRFTGDLDEYRIQATAGEVSVDVTLTGQIPPWRPATGHMLFGSERDLEFAWLPSVPQGIVTGSCTVDGATRQASGVGYHDHNWGNVGIMKIIHDWYWARGQAGQYSVIASFITAQKKYGNQTIPLSCWPAMVKSWPTMHRWCGSRRRASTPMGSPVSRSRPSADMCTNRVTTKSWCPSPASAISPASAWSTR